MMAWLARAWRQYTSDDSGGPIGWLLLALLILSLLSLYLFGESLR